MLMNTSVEFDQKRSTDGRFFLLAVAVIWIIILTSFVPNIIRHFASGRGPNGQET